MKLSPKEISILELRLQMFPETETPLRTERFERELPIFLPQMRERKEKSARKR